MEAGESQLQAWGAGAGAVLMGGYSLPLAAARQQGSLSFAVLLGSPFYGGTSLCIPCTLEHRGMLPTSAF